MKKHNPEAFESFAKEIPFKPEECVFIDDHMPNIQNAKKAGFNTIYYKEFPRTSKIKRKLRKLGVIL